MGEAKLGLEDLAEVGEAKKRSATDTEMGKRLRDKLMPLFIAQMPAAIAMMVYGLSNATIIAADEYGEDVIQPLTCEQAWDIIVRTANGQALPEELEIDEDMLRVATTLLNLFGEEARAQVLAEADKIVNLDSLSIDM